MYEGRSINTLHEAYQNFSYISWRCRALLAALYIHVVQRCMLFLQYPKFIIKCSLLNNLMLFRPNLSGFILRFSICWMQFYYMSSRNAHFVKISKKLKFKWYHDVINDKKDVFNIAPQIDVFLLPNSVTVQPLVNDFGRPV